MNKINEERIRKIRDGKHRDGPVIYWMSRDQRARDNWALLFAQQKALEEKRALSIVFSLVPEFLGAALRQYSFMLKGLQELQRSLKAKNIPFFLLAGHPHEEVPKFAKKFKASVVITDFDPLRIKRGWKEKVKDRLNIPIYEVDTHNIVPCYKASSKQEWAAYTFRPKMKRLLPQFLEEFPLLKKHPFSWSGNTSSIRWDQILASLSVVHSVSEVRWIKPGEKAAQKLLKEFLNKKLSKYDRLRNDPSKDGQSHLSPYLHFGQISAQRIALEVEKKRMGNKTKEAFLEELIVRRELSDNFCFYNPRYDFFEGFPDWAKKSLNEKRRDKREYIYSLNQFEEAKTHDDLWNAAQQEMMMTGKMHGYMRMYWCKKILEWTASPEEAIEIAITLNDKYELDGRDPNGYTGIAWSIGGVHDRAWPSRKVFGKVRYMNYEGCRRKFNLRNYISKVKK
jgi:deoxyribodipyrimidine photo-lyase